MPCNNRLVLCCLVDVLSETMLERRRRQCCAADGTPVGVIPSRGWNDPPHHQPPLLLPSVHFSLPIHSFLLPAFFHPFTLHTLLHSHSSPLLLPFFSHIHSTLLHASLTKRIMQIPLPSLLLLRRLLWGRLLSLIGHSPLFSCNTPFPSLRCPLVVVEARPWNGPHFAGCVSSDPTGVD